MPSNWELCMWQCCGTDQWFFPPTMASSFLISFFFKVLQWQTLKHKRYNATIEVCARERYFNLYQFLSISTAVLIRHSSVCQIHLCYHSYNLQTELVIIGTLNPSESNWYLPRSWHTSCYLQIHPTEHLSIFPPCEFPQGAIRMHWTVLHNFLRGMCSFCSFMRAAFTCHWSWHQLNELVIYQYAYSIR